VLVCWRINNVTCLTAIICELFFTRCRHTKWSILSGPAIYELLGLLRPLGPFISTSRTHTHSLLQGIKNICEEGFALVFSAVGYLHCTEIMNNNIQRRRSNVGLMTSSLVQGSLVWIFLCDVFPSETAQLSGWHMCTICRGICKTEI